MDEPRYRSAEAELWRAVGATPKERHLQLQRLGVTVRIQEVGHGPPILFVHGASNSGTSWSTLVTHLRDFRCILLDRPGCGLSQPLARFADINGLREYAEVLIVDVLDALELPSAHVAGTSFGGYPVLRTAAVHPERINRLILYGWFTGAPSSMPLFMRLSGVRWLARLGTAVPPNERMVRAMLKRVGVGHALQTGGFPDEAVRAYRALLRDTQTMRNELLSGGGRFMTLRGLDPATILPDDLLARVTAPTLMIWGEHDPFGSPEVGAQVAQRLPDARLEVLADAGHAVWMDDAERVAATTVAFLNDGSPRGE